MIFANIKNIVIPEGNVKKIHEKDTGRVLWEKKTSPTYEAGYPKVGVLIQTSDYGNVWAGDSGILTPYINKWALKSDLVGWGGSGYSYAYPTGGAICTPYCFYNSAELSDPINKGHLITDAKWSNSEIRFYPRTGGMTGPDYYVTRSEVVVRYANSPNFPPLISFSAPGSLDDAQAQLVSEGYTSSGTPAYSKILLKFNLLLSSISYGIENRFVIELGDRSSGG